MTERAKMRVSRRDMLRTAALAAASPILLRSTSAGAQAKTPTKVLDFQTLADVAKAEQEGEVVYYGHDGEAAIGDLLDSFRKDFPKIKTSYVRAQTGALYAKITAERSAGRFVCDVLQLSDITPAVDFQIYDQPRNRFVADFVGSANLIHGRRREDLERDGMVVLETAAGALVYGTATGRRPSAEVLLSIRTVHLHLTRGRPTATTNTWPARIRRRVFQGDLTQYHVEWSDGELVVRSTTADQLGEGDEAYVTVDPRHCVLLED